MLSLRFPIPIQNTPIPMKTNPKPKPFPSQNQITNRKHQSSQLVPPFSLPRLPKLLAASTDQRILAGDLPEGLIRELMPRHVAMIMDGNGRWAQKRGLPTNAGHEAGAKSLREIVDLCLRWKIKVLTVFAFSTENWNRSTAEVEYLMALFAELYKSDMEKYESEDIRVSVIGDLLKLPNSLQDIISEVEETTKDNTQLHVMIAVSYSGKYDVVQACKSVAKKVKDGLIPINHINEDLIEQELETKCSEFPYPDLLIRTSGEYRLSNFLLWQLAYTELFFEHSLWPDFGEKQFIEALTSYQNRQRRFGARGS